MVNAGFLGVTAQLGLVLAGFSGVITSLRGGRLHPLDVVGVRSMLLESLAVVFFSLFPLLIQATLNSDQLALSISSAALAVLAVYFQVSHDLRLRRVRQPMRRLDAVVVFNVVNPVVVVALVLNAILWHGFAVYGWAITWSLLGPSIQLFISVVASADERT